MAAEGVLTADPTPTPAPGAPAPTPAPTPSPEPTPAPSGKWYEKWPEGLRNEKTLHNYADEAAALQALVDAKKWQNGALKIPGKDAKPEEIAAFREKLGVPKTAADYDLSSVGITLDPGQKEAVLGAFHKMGLTQEQVSNLLPWAYQREQQQKAQLNEGYLTELDKLADEWGESVFNRRVNRVQGLLRRYGSPELTAWLESSKNTNNPLLLKLLAPIADQFAEDGYIDSDIGGNAPNAGEIDKQIDALREQIVKAVDGSPAHRALLSKYEDLWKLRAEMTTGAR